MLVLRAMRWYRDLARLGMHLPLFVVHDVGLLFAAPPSQWTWAEREGQAGALATAPALATTLPRYRAMLAELAKSEAALRAGPLRLTDDLLVVLLARILAAASRRIVHKPSYPATLPLELDGLRDLDRDLARLFASVPRAFERDALDALERTRLYVLTMADALDIDTLRLLAMFGTESMGALAQVDLLSALSTPETNDIVNFSLELLPSVLETHRTKSAGTHAADGYAGIGSQGSVDSLVLTELAWDDDEFARRFVERELSYYTREQAPDEARRLHCILVDASASMRGERQVFARGLAIALAKKLQLAGEEVSFRFFDSRLYEWQRVRGSQLPVPYILSFKGERGRHPSRVFSQLLTEVSLLRTRAGKDPVLHLVTHAALHVPRTLIAELGQMAHLMGVFILPSGGTLDLDYLDLLEGYTVVDHATLAQKSARAAAASRIVQDVTQAASPSSRDASSRRTSMRAPSVVGP